MTPCFHEDGEVALRNGTCSGCGKTPEELDGNPSPITLNDEQALVAKKMNIAVTKFAAKMKSQMVHMLLDGTAKGWDTVPAYIFLDAFNESVDCIRDGTSITDATVSEAIYAMLIGMRSK